MRGDALAGAALFRSPGVPVHIPARARPSLDYEAGNRGARCGRAPADVTDDEYREFYRHIANDTEARWAGANTVEGKREYTSLLYPCRRARRSTCGSAMRPAA